MSEPDLVDVLVVAIPGELDRVIESVGGMDGTATHVFPPRVAIVRLPSAGAALLQQVDLILSVHSQLVAEDEIAEASEELADAYRAWNRHLQRQGVAPAEGVAWDDARFQPPDPPRDVRDRLRRREERLRDGEPET